MNVLVAVIVRKHGKEKKKKNEGRGKSGERKMRKEKERKIDNIRQGEKFKFQNIIWEKNLFKD